MFDLPQFLSQSRLVLDDERRLLDDVAAAIYRWLAVLLFLVRRSEFAHACGASTMRSYSTFIAPWMRPIGEVMRREPAAELMVMSDHGFAAFDRAVNLNTFLISRGLRTKAYALGLNGLYLPDKHAGPEIRRQLLELRDPANGRSMIESVTETNPSPENRSIAPDLIVGYSAGYRASWQTALGEAPEGLVVDNDDAWIADHCIDPKEVPAVLFTTREIRAKTPQTEGSARFPACALRRRAAGADDGTIDLSDTILSCRYAFEDHRQIEQDHLRTGAARRQGCRI